MTSCNMFAYCGNNPIIRSDPSGHLWRIVAIIAVMLFCFTGCDGHKSESGSSDATENLQPESDISSTTENQVEIDPDVSSADNNTSSSSSPSSEINLNSSSYISNSDVNPFNMTNGDRYNCTWFSSGRANEITGKILGVTGSPCEWIEQASKNGWETGTECRPPCIAVFQNHVLVVESIYWDNGQMLFNTSESGTSSGDALTLRFGRTFQSMSSYSGGGFIGYIYLS